MLIASVKCNHILKKMKSPPLSLTVQIYDCFVNSIFLFGIVSWGVSNLDEFTRIQARFFIYFLGLSKMTNHNLLLSFLGRACSKCIAFQTKFLYFNKTCNANEISDFADFLMSERTGTTFCADLEKECRERNVPGIFLFNFNDPKTILIFKIHNFLYCKREHLDNGVTDSFNFNRKMCLSSPHWSMKLPFAERRLVLSFVLSSWRLLPEVTKVHGFLSVCPRCNVNFNSEHVLIFCPVFRKARHVLIFRENLGTSEEILKLFSCNFVSSELISFLNSILALMLNPSCFA